MISATRLRAGHAFLGLAIGHPVGTAFDRLGEFRAQRQVLERDFAPRAFVAAFDHRDGGAALVGIFELIAHLAVADIGFGADACGAQLLRHGEGSGGICLVEHRHHHQRRQRCSM